MDYEFIVYINDHATIAQNTAECIEFNSERCHKKQRLDNGGFTNDLKQNIGPEYRYLASPLGKATAMSGIAPHDAVPVLFSLQEAKKRLV